MTVQSNIWKYYVFSFLDLIVLYLPFIVYYFQELGFSLGKIAILQSAMAITLVIVEIPSGYFADRFGRKNSLVVSVLLQLVSMVILYYATSFYMLIISHIVAGLAIAFLSGADSALLYDSLKSLNKADEYKRIEGKAKFFQETAVIISSLAGALIIKSGFQSTIIVSIIAHMALLFITFSFREPPHDLLKKIPLDMEVRRLWKIIQKSLGNRKLLGLFVYSFVVLGVSNTIFMMYQPYFGATGLPVPMFGVVFALFSVFTALAALKAHYIEKRLGVFRSLLMMPLLIAAALLGAGFFFVWFGFLFFIIREVVRGFTYPVLGDYINRIVSSAERATVLSVGSMFSRIGLVAISISFGFSSDIIGLRINYIFMGFALLVFVIIIPFFMRNNTESNLKAKID